DGGIECNSVALGPVRHAPAGARDDAGGFVAHDDRRTPAAGAAVHPVHVAAADAAGLDRDKHFALARLGRGHPLGGGLLVLLKDQGLHETRCRRCIRSVTAKSRWTEANSAERGWPQPQRAQNAKKSEELQAPYIAETCCG